MTLAAWGLFRATRLPGYTDVHHQSRLLIQIPGSLGPGCPEFFLHSLGPPEAEALPIEHPYPPLSLTCGETLALHCLHTAMAVCSVTRVSPPHSQGAIKAQHPCVF